MTLNDSDARCLCSWASSSARNSLSYNCRSAKFLGSLDVQSEWFDIMYNDCEHWAYIYAAVIRLWHKVFIFYFISIVYYVIFQLSACMSDTCILKDQSINQDMMLCERVLTD